VKEQGCSEGADSSQTKTEPKEQGRPKNPSEAGKDYRDALRSIRSNQDLETFASDLRQNEEQLLSFAQDLISGKAVPAKTAKEAKDNTTLGIWMDFAIRYTINPHLQSFEVFSINPADWRDEYTKHKPMSEAEKRERLAERAARRVASKWKKNHPWSVDADFVMDFGLDTTANSRLLQEMWPAILYGASLTSKTNKS
jgi:hypothetical protein